MTQGIGELPEQANSALHASVVAELFAAVFDREAVDIDQDFFRLGGDSLLAVSLMLAIEKRFGLVLSISTLLEAPTPRTLAAAIVRTNVARIAPCLISIRKEGIAPSIFCVHGTDGESVAPLRLSSAIGLHPFHGFRALGLEQGEPIPRSVDAIAAGYLSAMAHVEPYGANILLGHCAGATIAYEMARQLAAGGSPLAGLILIDPEVKPDWAPFLYESGLKLSLLQSSWRKRGDLISGVMKANPMPTGEMRRKLVKAALQHAVATYTHETYSGSTLLICSPERKAALLNKQRGYPALIPRLHVVELSARHEMMFTDGVAQIAAAVGSFIRRQTP